MRSLNLPPSVVTKIMVSRFQKGSSLLEVLITMLVMSFGLLALGGLTAASLQYSKITQYQAIGSQLAIEYGDRMRGNVAGFQANNYDQTAAYTGASSKIALPVCATAAKCTPAEVAAIDIAEWKNGLQRRLPGGGAYVVRDATNTLAADIWVMWVEPNLNFNTTADSLLVSATGGDQCPANSGVAALPATTPTPRCLHFRISL